MSQSSFTDPKTTYSLYCTSCLQSIWFQWFSSLSISGVGPDPKGTHLALLPSHLYLQMLRHPIHVPKLLAPNSFILKIRVHISNFASAHKISILCWLIQAEFESTLTFEDFVVRYFYTLLMGKCWFYCEILEFYSYIVV